MTGPSANVGVFVLPIHLIRSLLSFPESARRRQPFALPYPCNVEHHILIESPGIQRGQNIGDRNHSAPFQFSFTTTQMPGSFGIKYNLRTTADSVAPDKFDNFKEKVREVWGWTLFTFQLRLGVSVPWGSRQGANLVSRRRGERRDPKPAPSATEPDFAPVLSPAEIAPPLASNAKAKFEVRTEAPKLEPAAPHRPRPAPEVRAPSAPAGPRVMRPTPTIREMQGSRRRRRSRKKSSSKRQLWITAAILAAIATVLVGVYFMFS
jgi:hypothetical protein